MKEKETNILIIEPSDIVREGLYALLKSSKNGTLQVQQCNGDLDLVQAVRRAAPDILITSPGVNDHCEKQIKDLKKEHNPIHVGLIYHFHHPDSLKLYDGLINVSDAVEKIHDTLTGLLKSRRVSDRSSPVESLSNRENEILRLLVHGNTTKDIAQSLHLSAHTVNAHRKNIMRKLNIKTISGLTIYAVLNNVISLEDV